MTPRAERLCASLRCVAAAILCTRNGRANHAKHFTSVPHGNASLHYQPQLSYAADYYRVAHAAAAVALRIGGRFGEVGV